MAKRKGRKKVTSKKKKKGRTEGIQRRTSSSHRQGRKRGISGLYKCEIMQVWMDEDVEVERENRRRKEGMKINRAGKERERK